MMQHQPAEEQHRAIKVRFIWLREKETVEVQSVSEAIETVKSKSDRPSCSKIILDEEVVYNSNRNGSIGDWEVEWDRAKRAMSVSETAYDCPHGIIGCCEDDLCLDCQMDKAMNQ